MNAAEIQSKIDALGGPGRVVIPPGLHWIESTLRIERSDVTLAGEGNPVLMTREGVGDVLRIGTGESQIDGVRVTGLTVCGGEDGARPTNTGHGILIRKALRTKLVDVQVLRTALDCVSIEDSWWLKTEDCVFDLYHCGADAVAFRHGRDSNNVLHSHSRFVARRSGVACQIDHGASITFASAEFSGDDDAGTGLKIAGTGYGVNVLACYFENCGACAIDIAGSDGQILNPQLRGNFFSINKGTAIRLGAVVRGMLQGNCFAGEGFTAIEAQDTERSEGTVIEADNYLSSNTARRVVDTGGRTVNKWAL